MVTSEQKTVNSEIEHGSYTSFTTSLTALHFAVHYIVLDDLSDSRIVSPITGFLNILFPESASACICPYFLQQQSYVIRAGENMIHAVQEGDVLEWKSIYNQHKALAIFVPSEVLSDFSLKFDENMKRFKNGMLTKSDHRIALLVNQILDLIQQDSPIHRLRTQAFIIDTLVHQIEGFYAENRQQEIIINKSHYEKIMLAKKIIEKDLSKNYTIPELAKMIGTNEQYLKKYFKQHFGNTVMGHITELKMQHARDLMMTGEYRVADVARLTGYKHSTHFTTAFKKYFGFIPNSLRYTFLIAHEGAKLLSEFEGMTGLL